MCWLFSSWISGCFFIMHSYWSFRSITNRNVGFLLIPHIFILIFSAGIGLTSIWSIIYTIASEFILNPKIKSNTLFLCISMLYWEVVLLFTSSIVNEIFDMSYPVIFSSVGVGLGLVIGQLLRRSYNSSLK